MSESAVQMPDLIHTAMGGKTMARRARRQSEEHIVSLLLVFRSGCRDGDVGIEEGCELGQLVEIVQM